MGEPGSYDGDLQMFVAPPREPNMLKMQFLRWLAETGHWEHRVAGRPCGEYALLLRARQVARGAWGDFGGQNGT